MHTQYSVLKYLKQALFVLLSCLMLTGCPLEGDDGKSGVAGLDGINCWDTNSNRTNDPEEDINLDGTWNSSDCLATTQSKQNPDVDLNHQHICEALANLGQYPQGCPSNGHSIPSGTLTKINSLLDSGSGYAVSCDFEPNNGLLSVIPKNGAYSWSLEGGYIAKVITVSAVDELTNDACYNLCDADSNCIASWAVFDSPAEAHTCHLFYHSDTVGNWERSCASDIADCAAATGALSTDQRWSAICP